LLEAFGGGDTLVCSHCGALFIFPTVRFVDLARRPHPCFPPCSKLHDPRPTATVGIQASSLDSRGAPLSRLSVLLTTSPYPMEHNAVDGLTCAAALPWVHDNNHDCWHAGTHSRQQKPWKILISGKRLSRWSGKARSVQAPDLAFASVPFDEIWAGITIPPRGITNSSTN